MSSPKQKKSDILVGKENIGYMGEDYQYRLVKCFIEDTQYFIRIQHLVDQNMFTVSELRMIVGFLKDRYAQTGRPALYTEISMHLNRSINDDITRERAQAIIEQIKGMSMEAIDMVEEEATNFFKQQNMIRFINKASEIIRRGDISQYPVIEDMLQQALSVNMREEVGKGLFEDEATIEADLSPDFRRTITTGVHDFDVALGGGLGRGELGLIVSPMNVGKAHPLSTRILTPDGYRTMGEMAVGSVVFDNHGTPCKVTGVFPQGVRDIYEVRFADGRTCECDLEHLWTVKRTESWSEDEWKTLTLREIWEEMQSNQSVTFGIPKNSAIREFNESVDESVCESLIECINYGTIVPLQLQYSSEKVRRKVYRRLAELYGVGVILDSNVDTLLVPTDAVDGVAFVCRSLGYDFIRSSSLDKVDKPDSVEYLVVKNSARYDRLRIESVEYKRTEEAQCIMVDSPEHLYIVEDFIVTHNTSVTTGFAAAAAVAKSAANNDRGYKVLHIFFEDTEVAIRRKYYGYLLNIDSGDLSLPHIRPEALRRLNDEFNEERRMLKENIKYLKMASGEETATSIKNVIRKNISLGFKPDIVIIDYFECLATESNVGKHTSEWTGEAISMRKLESMASEFDVAVWVPVQSTKDAIGEAYVGLKNAGGSVRKTQIGHVVMQLARTEEQKTHGEINVYIGKLRGVKFGRDKFLNVKFNNGTCRFDLSNATENFVDNNFQSAPPYMQVPPNSMQTANMVAQNYGPPR